MDPSAPYFGGARSPPSYISPYSPRPPTTSAGSSSAIPSNLSGPSTIPRSDVSGDANIDPGYHSQRHKRRRSLSTYDDESNNTAANSNIYTVANSARVFHSQKQSTLAAGIIHFAINSVASGIALKNEDDVAFPPPSQPAPSLRHQNGTTVTSNSYNSYPTRPIRYPNHDPRPHPIGDIMTMRQSKAPVAGRRRLPDAPEPSQSSTSVFQFGSAATRRQGEMLLQVNAEEHLKVESRHRRRVSKPKHTKEAGSLSSSFPPADLDAKFTPLDLGEKLSFAELSHVKRHKQLPQHVPHSELEAIQARRMAYMPQVAQMRSSCTLPVPVPHESHSLHYSTPSTFKKANPRPELGPGPDLDLETEVGKESKSLTMPTGTIPPELPPSVEEAYRKKCIELKRRLGEVEDANDASRQRLARLERGVQKLRLERAMLLEQQAKRTSTNVEDSEGSPSPPPTPKEKPLRTKRGHRKPDFLTTDVGDGRPGSAFIQQGPVTLSPSSDAFSHTHPDPLRNSTPQAQSQSSKRQLPSNGINSHVGGSNSTPSGPRRPRNAFDLYCNEIRPKLSSKEKTDPSYDIETALARGWRELENDKKDQYTQRFEQIKREGGVGGGGRLATFDGANDQDEDVEMGDDGTPSGGGEGGGFTAVNRS